jgi:uncharacterized protein (AIM24 family)
VGRLQERRRRRGGFLIHATGGGSVVVSCYGALDTMELGQGESVVVDSGHLVAFDPNIAFTARKASSGLMNTIKSGEGFVLEFTDPERSTRRLATRTRWSPG